MFNADVLIALNWEGMEAGPDSPVIIPSSGCNLKNKGLLANNQILTISDFS
jgi:hypothetical protein